MSFSSDLKQEILDNRPMRMRFKRAQAYGLFLFGQAFGGERMEISSENEEIPKLYQWFAGMILGKKGAPALQGRQNRGKAIHSVRVEEAEDRARILAYFGGGERLSRELLRTSEEAGAFLAGAFLACGNIIDPEKSYHMEFVVRRQALCGELALLLGELIPGVRVSTRRNNHICYYKECGPIEDLMTLMGATKSCLRVIDIEMYKSVRNRANRATNCETANIDKQVDAASSQIEDIQLVLERRGEEELPDALRQAARLRLDNPEASLRELQELSAEPISRSGLYHRLDKLSRLARELREQGK